MGNVWSLLWADMNAATPPGSRGRSALCAANVGRASTLAAAEMASYDALKPVAKDATGLAEGLPLHAVTASAAGFIAAAVANPFDVVKSRVMNSPGEYAPRAV